MRHSIAGAAVLAALLAALAVPSAAPATALCEANESPCLAEDFVGEGAEVQLESSNPVITTNVTNATCEQSSATISLSNDGGEGEPVAAQVTAFSFTGNCKTAGGTACTFTVVNLPYSASFEGSGGNGSMTVTDPSGAGASVKCGFLINCTFTAKEAELTITGGAPATVVAAKVPLERTGGFCPATAEWDATYTVGPPNPMFVVAGPPVPTKLCNAEEKFCEVGAGKTYAAATEPSGVAANAEIVIPVPGGGVARIIDCNTSSLVGKTKEKENSPLRTELKSLTFGECKLRVGGGACLVTATSRSGKESTIVAHGNKKNGDWRLEVIELRIECPTTKGLERCEYEEQVKTEIQGGNPATAVANANFAFWIGGSVGHTCPNKAPEQGNPVVWKGNYVLSPEPLYVTN